VASTNEFLITKPKNRLIPKVRVKDNLHAVVAMIEKCNSAYLVEDGIIGIVGHIVSNDGGQGIPLQKMRHFRSTWSFSEESSSGGDINFSSLLTGISKPKTSTHELLPHENEQHDRTNELLSGSEFPRRYHGATAWSTPDP
jgi:hypothetical protein